MHAETQLHTAAPTAGDTRVLLVEDDPLFRRFIVAALGEARAVQIRPDVVGSLEAAVQALQSQTYACILLDLGLPDSQGTETLARTLLAANGIPVVVLTGREQEDTAKQALLAGAQDFIEKSDVEPGTLERAIRHAMDRAAWSAHVAEQNRELERRNQELDDFAHAISHDLRAPLRAIYHRLQEAREAAGEEEESALDARLTGIQERVAYLFDMIEAVLRLAGAAAKAQGQETVEVGDLMRGVLERLEIPPHFQVSIPAVLPRITTSATALGQVLQNLLDNALKHHDQARGNIELGCLDHGLTLEFTVRDDGPGIPAQSQSRIFDLFAKSDPTRKGTSGIGLALVRKLVEGQGGHITLDRSEGRGATFRFTWPKGNPP